MAKYKTRNFLLAQHEADQCRIADLTAQLGREQRRNQELREQLSIANNVPQLSQRQLMAKCRELNARGVPCKMRGPHIYHAMTGAILV